MHTHCSFQGTSTELTWDTLNRLQSNGRTSDHRLHAAEDKVRELEKRLRETKLETDQKETSMRNTLSQHLQTIVALRQREAEVLKELHEKTAECETVRKSKAEATEKNKAVEAKVRGAVDSR